MTKLESAKKYFVRLWPILDRLAFWGAMVVYGLIFLGFLYLVGPKVINDVGETITETIDDTVLITHPTEGIKCVQIKRFFKTDQLECWEEK